MKEYTFQYTKQAIGYLLFLLMFGMMPLLIFVLAHFFYNFLLLDVITAIVLPVIFFLLNKHHIKRIGQAGLSATGLKLELSKQQQINFNEVKYYYIYNGNNGLVFTLGLLNGEKIKIGANNNFCDVEGFKAFLTDFQSDIETYNAEHGGNIIHLESVFARKNTVYVLSTLTVLAIAGYCFTKMPVMILPIGLTLPLVINWIQYFQLKRKNKLVDF